MIINKKTLEEWKDNIKMINDEYHSIYKKYGNIVERSICDKHSRHKFIYNYRITNHIGISRPICKVCYSNRNNIFSRLPNNY